MQVELWQQLTNLLRLPLEEREHTTDKPLVQISDAGPAHGDGPTHQGQASGLAITIAILRSRIVRTPPSGWACGLWKGGCVVADREVHQSQGPSSAFLSPSVRSPFDRLTLAVL